ncbi:hypothetical protein [Streptomyces sp. NPDC056244]|uniref:hypothetical protein n=1 Tax=Streptomyces sp. NPDC056244 TaxID=3345762 RepID=UPI0035D8EC6E
MRYRSPEQVTDLRHGLLEDRTGEVLVAAMQPTGLAGFSAHDGVNDRARDAKDQQDGRCGVAGVVEAPGLQQILPPVVVGVRVERLTTGDVNTYPFSTHRSRASRRSRAWLALC